MHEHRNVARHVGPVAVVLAAGLALAGAPGAAQEASPAATGGKGPFPAAIFTGSCDALGDAAFPLEELATPPPAGATPGPGTPGAGDLVPAAAGLGQVLASSTTNIEAANEDLLADPHAVAVLQQPDRPDTVAACGEIVGTGSEEEVQGRGAQVLVRLEERNQSGLRGIAILTELGPGSLTVAVNLAPSDSVVLATPESTPAP